MLLSFGIWRQFALGIDNANARQELNAALESYSVLFERAPDTPAVSFFVQFAFVSQKFVFRSVQSDRGFAALVGCQMHRIL